ncbi:MAG: phosphoenolpyruvate carboxylase [Chloroflexi bacterium]|nr:phosphoenolpyruvate carboxylase [Chloroflexota bacterium]
MRFVPKVMSTQHPDNATPAPFADAEGVLKGEGEVDEAHEIFALGCNEQMWDSEGKEADNHVVQKLLTGYPDFFQDDRRLGHDVILTLRVPNPSVERDMRKSMVEALQSVPSAWDVASGFYAGMEEENAPIQEVILPFTTSAQELTLVEAYYRQVIVGQETHALPGGRTIRDWIGEFSPKRIRLIPLVEDRDNLLRIDTIVDEYLRGRDLPYQRVFLARSDPALNYGIVGAELILKVALQRLHRLEGQIGIPLYPIIGAGSAPFRGHLTPLNIDRTFLEYPSAQTVTVQSAFKYDYDRETVRDSIALLRAHTRRDPRPVDEQRALEIIEKTTAAYQERVVQLTDVIAAASAHVPRRRERKMHVGLFGYGRSLDGVGGATLPRAIGFAASLYSIGVPPDLLGLSALDEDDWAFVRESYPSVAEDLRAALRFTNERHVRELLGEDSMRVVARFTDEVDRIHEGLTSAIWAAIKDDAPVEVRHYVEQAAKIRRYLG